VQQAPGRRIEVVLARGQLDAAEAGERAAELLSPTLRAETPVDAPVVGRDERHPLAFPLDHDPGRDGLHPARGELGHHLAPEDGRDLVAVEPVEDPPGLLGVHQVVVQLPGLRGGLPDGRRRDLVEHHPLDRHPGLEGLQQVPGDGLTLAVLVGGQEELVGVGEQRAQLGDLCLLVRRDHVERLETVVDVHAQAGPRLALVLGGNIGGAARQVADVPDRRFHDVSAAEVAGDGARLGRRLDHDELDAAVGGLGG
jgi:hypothetical protein